MDVIDPERSKRLSTTAAVPVHTACDPTWRNAYPPSSLVTSTAHFPPAAAVPQRYHPHPHILQQQQQQQQQQHQQQHQYQYQHQQYASNNNYPSINHNSQPQPSLPSLAYPAFPTRELPNLSPDASTSTSASASAPTTASASAPVFTRTNSLPAVSNHVSPQLQTSPHAHPISDHYHHRHHHHLINGSPFGHVSHPAPVLAPVPAPAPAPPPPPPDYPTPHLAYPQPSPPPPPASHASHAHPVHHSPRINDVPSAATATTTATQYAVPPMSHLPPETPGSYDQNCFSNLSVPMPQRKATRALQACDQCRSRKAKCDEGRPSCSHCKENNLVCIYKEVPPHKQDKATQALFDRFQHLDGRFQKLEDLIEERFSQLQSVQVQQGSDITQIGRRLTRDPLPLSTVDTQKYPIGNTPQLPSQQPLVAAAAAAPVNVDVRERSLSNDVHGTAALSTTTTKTATTPTPDNNPVIPDGDDDKEDGGLSIPVDHTTAAHKLLRWPSIRNLLHPSEYDEDYVMQLEESRGLIRVYGRGEGDDSAEDGYGSQSFPLPYPSFGGTTTVLSSSPSDDRNGRNPNLISNHPSFSEMPSPSSSSPSSTTSSMPFETRAGITDSGMLITDADTVRFYYGGYLRHIHKLHPFLNQNELDRDIEEFIALYCTPPGGVGDEQHLETPRGPKRKRSHTSSLYKIINVRMETPLHPHSGFFGHHPRRVEKSIRGAIVLLVLALGAVCEWRKLPIPGPVSKHSLDFQKERIPGPSKVPYGTSSSDVAAGAAADHSFNNSHSFSSSTHVYENDYSHPPQPRNLDVIPGLAYYAYAAEILGTLQGANELPNVQAALLAGLYAGQLAHPFQSYGWIYQAAKACQVLIRPKKYEILNKNEGALKDLHGFAYWTCLQLESDILAELDLPASGISRSESRIDLPSGRYTLSLPNEISAPSTMMMVFYSAQIHLRKVLNRVHTDLYKSENEGQNKWSTSVQETLSTNLTMWRSKLPEVMKWRDSDPPSNDINVARMRAKYYGARYIIYRPLLYHALHLSPSPSSSSSSAAAAGGGATTTNPNPGEPRRSSGGSPSGPGDGRGQEIPIPGSSVPLLAHGSIWPGPTWRELPTKLRRACTVCINSAIASTTAFDAIQGRPVVTNIFGTAHAQFGNMLVLAATYTSNLSELVDRDQLEQLLKRTIRFLLQSRYISPSLRADARILTEIYYKIFGEPVNLEGDGPGSGSGRMLVNLASCFSSSMQSE